MISEMSCMWPRPKETEPVPKVAFFQRLEIKYVPLVVLQMNDQQWNC